MRTLVRSLAGTAVAFLATGSFAFAACTQDTLTVDGAPLGISLCAAGAGPEITVNATFTRGTASFARPLTIDVPSGAEVARAVSDVPLTALGVSKVLHMTMAYRAGSASLEHALLLPGAIVLK